MFAGISVLQATVSVHAGSREVGRVELPYPAGKKIVHIEDVSPDQGTKTMGVDQEPWGVSLSVSVSGIQGAYSSATSGTAPNGPVIVDHVTATDSQGHLIVFFWSPDDQKDSARTAQAAWKAVDVSEKTGKVLVTERPASWQVTKGKTLVEHHAGRDSKGNLFDFSWQSGHDWKAQQVNGSGAPKIAGPVSAWTIKSGGKVEEFIAAPSSGSHLVIFSRQSGAAWKHTVISKKISGPPTGFGGSSTIVAEGPSNHLLTFERLQSGKWAASDLTTLSKIKQKVKGRVTTWMIGYQKYIGARAPNGDLVVFKHDPIDSLWSVENVTKATGGKKVADVPVHWLVPKGREGMINLAAPDASGRVLVFSRQRTSAWSKAWSFVDVTTKTGVKIHVPLTAWTTPLGNGLIEHLAGPDQNGRMHVFNWRLDNDWEAVDVSTRSAGRVVYSNATYSGVWSSRDYGLNWKQSKRPQPSLGAIKVDGALPVKLILDVAVSQYNPDIVLAAADREGRKSSLAGIYRSENGGETWKRVYTFKCNGQIEGVSQIVFAPDDPKRLYAAGGCGIARSTDSGKTWDKLAPTDTPFDKPRGTRRVWHLAVSDRKGLDDQKARYAQKRTIVACGDNSLWVSREDGAKGSWVLDSSAHNVLPPNNKFCSKTGAGRHARDGAANVLALDPVDSDKVYYAHQRLANGPSYYVKNYPDGALCNIPLVYDKKNKNNKYGTFDANDIFITTLNRQQPDTGTKLKDDPKIIYVDSNSDGQWNNGEPVFYDSDSDGLYDKGERIVNGGQILSNTKKIHIKNDEHIKYVQTMYGSYESPYSTRGCGEGSLWYGDLSDLTSKEKGGSWSQLPGPPVYPWPVSGASFVVTHKTPKGYLVFFGDLNTVHVSEGKPVAGGWYRIDGLGASVAKRVGKNHENIFIHADPQAVAVSPDFDLTLKKGKLSDAYSLNAELDACKGGRIWVSNHGGVYNNDDCAAVKDKEKRWNKTHSGLNTAWAINIAGATGQASDMTTSAIPLAKRALYFGSTHDDDFFSMDDGWTWKDAPWTCGDCDTWYADLYQRNRVFKLDPRYDRFTFFLNSKNVPPDGSNAKSFKYPTGTKIGLERFPHSHYTIRGYRPVIQTLPGKTPPKKGDYILIRIKDGKRQLLRAYDSLDDKANDRGFTVVPSVTTHPFPSSASWVQAAGGHNSPTYYVGDGINIWRGRYNTAKQVKWEKVAPAASTVPTTTTVIGANRFFVSPWDPKLVYLIDVPGSAVRVSTNGGDSWKKDNGLSNAVSANGEWPFVCSHDDCLLNDMAFDPTNSQRRFAAGLAGVFFTADGGNNWHRLLDTRALPSRPRGLWFDPVTNPNDDALFVANMGRGILRLHPIPDTAPQQTSVTLVKPSPADKWKWKWDKIPNIIHDADFEPHKGWTSAGDVQKTRKCAHSGKRGVALGGVDHSGGILKQVIKVPCDVENVRLSFWWHMTTEEGNEGGDLLSIYLEKDGVPRLLERLVSTMSDRNVWRRSESDITSMGCGDMTISFSAIMNGSRPTDFCIDDIALEQGMRSRKPTKVPECPPGQYRDGDRCVCPEGLNWNGMECAPR